MRVGKWLFGTTAAVVMVAGLLAWQDNGSGPIQDAYVLPRTAPSRPSVTVPAAVLRPVLAISPDEESLKQQVERLIATRDPADAWLAYRLLADCAEFNKEHDRLTFDAAELKRSTSGYPGFRGMNDTEKLHASRLCSQMTERERQARLDFLSIAVKAGITGSAVAFAQEGPFGDRSALQTRPNDPLVLEWKALATAQLTTAAEEGGDMTAIAYLVAQYASGSELTDKKPLLAYRYQIAQGQIFRELIGRDNGLSKVFAPDSEMMVAMAKEFSPEERAAELAAADRIVEISRAHRKRAQQVAGG
ncbi:MAG: hypothetical protein JWQ01_2069 [Massilia sp.]|jgi:hypothetical protein|nr:hypothetical protein [Massilia sp.]